MTKHLPLSSPELQHAVGSDFVRRLNPTNPEEAPLKIGTDIFTIHELATKLGVIHARAARILSAAADAIGAKNTRDFYARSTPYSMASVEGLGTTTLYVAWRLFETKGLDPVKWFHRGQAEAVVSFTSLKAREQAAESRTKKSAPRRHTGNTAPASAHDKGKR